MRFLSIAVLVVCLPSTALAWGFDGHRITGQVAEQFLTPAAAAAVAGLLGGESLANATLWADTIKGSRPETRPWHYLNVPVGQPAVTTAHCPAQGCVLNKSIDFIDILSDPATTQADRLEALRFTLHLVGDMHNPMHLGLAEDLGGNRRDVLFNGSDTNLHALWDWGIISSTNTPWPTYAQQLTNNITAQNLADWTGDTPEDWATESYLLTHSLAYPDSTDEVYVVTNDYADAALLAINQRLSQAGVRLANLLNQAFDASLAGDYNADGFVSQADLDLVLLNWGNATLPVGWSATDQFDNQQISQNELDSVLLNWGDGSPPLLTAIPEPASAAAFISLCLLCGRRRND